jgi:peptide/nickel transport system substrate-binding protein
VDRSDESRGLLSAAALDRRQFLRGIAATGAFVGAGSLLAACSSSSTTSTGSVPSHAKRGGNLKAGLTGGGATDHIDPHQGLTYQDTSRLQSLYDPLVQIDANANTQFMLAESITNTNSNFTQWEIKLKPGITFHNGKPLTAEDVVFSFQRILKGAGGFPFSGANPLGPIDIKNTKAVDTHTVLVKMTSPYSSFVSQLAASWVYLYIAPVGFDINKPVGTGPFMYQSFKAGSQSVFKRNPHYWSTGLPYVDTLTIIDFTDTVSLADALTTGVIHAAGTLDGPQMASLTNTSGVKAVPAKSGGIVPFTMRVDQRPFNDVRVRQAMRLLVDRPQLIASALDGYATVANDVSSPYDPDFDTSLVRHQDISGAKSLLRAAGQEHLQVTLTTSQIATGTLAMATVLAEQAKAAGVNIKVQNVTSGVFFATPNYLKWNFSQDYYNYFPYLPQVAESMLKLAPFNETHTNSAYYNNLYNQANTQAPGSSLHKEIVHKMQQFDFEQGGYIIPAFVDTLDAYSNKIAGYTPGKNGQPLSSFDFGHFYFV